MHKQWAKSNIVRTVAMQSGALANEAGRRKALERFGYASLEQQISEQQLEREWSLLLPDFLADVGDLQSPAWRALTASQRLLAMEHVLQRRALDGMMNACDAAHQNIAAGGMKPELLEAYAIVRDQFEEAVDAFTLHRDRIALAMNHLS